MDHAHPFDALDTTPGAVAAVGSRQGGGKAGLAPGKRTEPTLPLKFLLVKLAPEWLGFAVTMGLGLFACLLFACHISSCSCVYLHFAGFNWDG